MGLVVCSCLHRDGHLEPLLEGSLKALSHSVEGKLAAAPHREDERPPGQAARAVTHQVGRPGRPGLQRGDSFNKQHLSLELNEVLCDVEGGPACAAPSPPSARPAEERPEPGDLVKLHRGAPPEFIGHKAVVTQVAEKHCTVAVLDAGCCFGIGECWPNLPDVVVTSRDWRLGARVVLDGFGGTGTKRMNGAKGTIARHPHSGHPSFVCKPAAPDEPRLTLCVHLDTPAPGGKSSVLVEPRYIRPYSTYVHQVARDLNGTLIKMGVLKDEYRGEGDGDRGGEADEHPGAREPGAGRGGDGNRERAGPQRYAADAQDPEANQCACDNGHGTSKCATCNAGFHIEA